jgi:hypothetical protein
MELEAEMNDPWPVLVDRLVRELSTEELSTIIDCLRDRFWSTVIKESSWRKKHEDPNTHRTTKIRNFIDFLSEEQTDQSGFIKLMLNVSEMKQLNFRTDGGGNITLKEFLKQYEQDAKKYEIYCRQKQMLKGSDFIGREKEMKRVTELLFRDSEQVAGKMECCLRLIFTC